MAVITSYSLLQDAVARYLARDDLADDIPLLIQNWEGDFLREPQNFGRWMEAALNVDIAASVAEIPDDYLGLKHAYVNTSPSSELDRMSLKQVLGKYPRGACKGRPRWIARGGGEFLFGPEPDAEYNIRGWYWAKPIALRDSPDDAAGHWLIENAPDLPLFGALLQATPFLMNDKRIPTWETFYSRALASYRDLNRDEEVSGSPVQEVLA